MEDHETECDGGVEHAISGDVNNDIGTDQDSEQEELFCRVCDPVDEDIGDEAEEESEVPLHGLQADVSRFFFIILFSFYQLHVLQKKKSRGL